MSSLKVHIRGLLGEKLLGALDYLRFPGRRAAWGGPFNGQERRIEIFNAIMAACRPSAIIETGTYLGTTTEFMAGCSLPVYTIEGEPRNYGFARARLWRKRNVNIRLGDSRIELRALFEGPLRAMKDETIFAYLDAHWNADLPLGEELDIVFRNCPATVVMIDDFQVPDDPGYGYDDYGPGKALTASYIRSAVANHGLRVLYPSTRSSEEGGARRGCAVLIKNSAHGRTLASCPLLRTAE